MRKRQARPEEDYDAVVQSLLNDPILRPTAIFLSPKVVPIGEPTPSLTPSSTVEDRLASTVEDGLASTVEDESSSTVVVGISSTVEDRLASTVEDGLASTVEDSQPLLLKNLWLAVGADGLFPASRVTRIQSRAQDVLTHVEEAVYDALWGTKRRDIIETSRLAQIGYSEMATLARVSKRSIQSVIDRLVDKLIIEIDAPANIMTRKPTVYRVYNYSAILNRIRERGYEYFVRTGKGIFYARPAWTSGSRTVEDRPPSTVEDSSPSTVEPASTVSQFTVEDRSPSTVEPASTPTTIGIKKEETTTSGINSTAISALAKVVLPIAVVDDDFLSQLITDCRSREAAATDDEIVYAAEAWLRTNAGNRKIGNLAMVLRTQLPKFFPSELIREYRRTRAARSNNLPEVAGEGACYAAWETISARHKTEGGYDLVAIAGDPEMDEKGREVALAQMRRVGRFSRVAI